MKKIILMLVIAVILGIISWDLEVLPKHERSDYSLIEVYYDNQAAAVVDALPGDTTRFGRYTIIYHKRR